jgi:proton-dependent oligopeptide transporter, POT family
MSGEAARDRGFFGHPKGLGVLAGTELWERFSFYGMQALLMLYMTQHLLKPENARRVWGLTGYREALEALFGPLTDLAFAAQTFGLYSGFIYVTPLLGAWLGDRLLGKTRTVTTGALLMSAGHLAMASERLFLVALLLLILGAGCVIGNMAAQVGQLYAPGDERRTRAFGVYLIALNIGALISPLVCGTLGETAGWHWGFGAAGIGMLIGLVIYLAGSRYLPPDRITRRGDRVRLTRSDWRSIAGILLTLLPYILATAALQQAYGIMLVWADGKVDHKLLGWEMPITWVLTLDGLMTIAGVVIATSIWKRAAARGREPGDIAKLGIGCAGIALAYLYLAAVANLPSVPILLFVGFYLILDLAIGWLEAPTASLTSRNAPAPVNATMMAVFKLATAFSYFFLGWLGRFFEPLGPSLYWSLTAALAGAGFLLVVAFGGRVARLLDPEASVDEPPALEPARSQL